MSENVPNSKPGSNGGEPATNELCAQIGRYELRDSKNAPLMFEHFCCDNRRRESSLPRWDRDNPTGVSIHANDRAIVGFPPEFNFREMEDVQCDT
jgi:hypothetical protein